MFGTAQARVSKTRKQRNDESGKYKLEISPPGTGDPGYCTMRRHIMYDRKTILAAGHNSSFVGAMQFAGEREEVER